MAVIVAIEALPYQHEVTLYSDSTYVVRPLQRSMGSLAMWIANPKRINRDLWDRLFRAIQERRHQIKAVWVRGHNGNELNEKCDLLANDSAISASMRGTFHLH